MNEDDTVLSHNIEDAIDVWKAAKAVYITMTAKEEQLENRCEDQDRLTYLAADLFRIEQAESDRLRARHEKAQDDSFVQAQYLDRCKKDISNLLET